MKIKFVELLLVLTTAFLTTSTIAYAATVDLGNVANFAVMGAAAISDTPSSVITGNVGLWSNGGASITGLRCIEVTGTIYDNNGAYTGNPTSIACLQTNAGTLTAAHTSLTSAYTDAAGRTPTTTYDPIKDLGGLTLTPGVYKDPSSFAVTGTLTLDGGGDANAVFIFQAGSTLTMADSSKIVLTGSAQSCNVFWQVGSSATFGTTAGTGIEFIGNILAKTSITDSGGTAVDGRLLAGSTNDDNTGAVTLNKTTVTKSTCATPTPTSTLTPTPTPTPTATSTSTSSTSSSGGTSGVFSSLCPPLTSSIVAPFVIESKRVSPTSIFLSWGPSSGTNLFNVEYGLERGRLLYNVDVSGFSTTINNLPANVPIWVQIAGRNDCRIGGYGVSKQLGGSKLLLSRPKLLLGGPKLPNTGFGS